MNLLGKSTKLYVYIIITFGMIILLTSLPMDLDRSVLTGFVVFALLAFISEAFPVDVGLQSSASVAIAFHVGAIVLFEPEIAMWVAVIGSGLIDLVDRKPMHKLLFNMSQYALCVGGSAIVYRMIAGEAATALRIDLIELFPALVLMIFAYLILNVTLVSIAIALSMGLSPLDIWMISYKGSSFQFFALGPMGILVALVYQSQPAGIILLGLPLVLARVALQNYVQLQSETMQTIETLADVIDKGDPHTFQHSQRVSEYAVQLARRLNLPEVDVQLIGSAARIHDLGKVTIPTNILQKAGKLTAEEFEIVKSHSAEGAKLVENLSLYQQGLDLILHHHERFDGTGYPSGLRENNIPLGARIICVADAFDAMTSDRPYRKAMSLDAAILELKRGMGTQFDPDVASAFVDYLEETTGIMLTEVAVSNGS